MNSRFVWRLAFIAFGIWFVWALHPLFAIRMQIPWNVEKVGQWGDAFGGLNALFSALAFIAVLFTLKQQRDELTRQQLQISRAEQNQHRQRFEDNFFQLLAVIRENRKDVRFRYSDDFLEAHPHAKSTTKKGHFAFFAAYREMLFWIKRSNSLNEPMDRRALAKLYAKKVHIRFESMLGAYFRLVYEILDRMERDQHLTQTEKDEFGNLVRGQMTSYEVTIAGCNALNEFAKDFERLVNRFRLLKYAKHGIVYIELRKIYPKETFEGRDTTRPAEPKFDEDLDDDDLPEDI